MLGSFLPFFFLRAGGYEVGEKKKVRARGRQTDSWTDDQSDKQTDRHDRRMNVRIYILSKMDSQLRGVSQRV